MKKEKENAVDAVVESPEAIRFRKALRGLANSLMEFSDSLRAVGAARGQNLRPFGYKFSNLQLREMYDLSPSGKITIRQEFEDRVTGSKAIANR